MNKKKIIKGYLNFFQLCKKLGISFATGKNWFKLGKIIPSKIVENNIYFDESYFKNLLNDLEHGNNSGLKSRRNKKFKNGFGLYKSYISENSKNLFHVEKLMAYFENKSINLLSQSDVIEILGYYALKILKSFCADDYNKYEHLCKDISSTDKIIKKHPYLTELNFVYEKGEDILGLLYLSLNGINQRKSQGSYYTPTKIVKKLIQQTFENYNGGKITDPCCGSGNFIINLPNNISAQNVFASDIDKLSVKIARLNFAMKYKISDKKFLYEHVNVRNFLFDKNEKYDYIMGNPPWAYDFDDKEKEILHNNFKTSQCTNIESYDVVTEKALSCLNKNGILSFVLPEAVLNVKSHSALREIILKNSSFKYLEYLGETFDGVQCPSIIVKILYDEKPFNTSGLKIKTKEKTFIIHNKREINSEVFDFNCDDSEYDLITRIENIPNKVTLKNNAEFALGIVTGNNSKYLEQNKTNKNEPIIKGTDIEKFRIKNIKNYIVFNPDKFQQCAPESVYRAEEKLLYKFISKKLVFAYDNTQTLTLNSCNILIPKIEGLDIKYILAVLNSDIAQFYFEKKFNSVKVLRSHLEQIPIPYVDDKKQKAIIDIVNKILNNNDSEELLKELNIKIKDLY